MDGLPDDDFKTMQTTADIQSGIFNYAQIIILADKVHCDLSCDDFRNVFPEISLENTDLGDFKWLFGSPPATVMINKSQQCPICHVFICSCDWAVWLLLSRAMEELITGISATPPAEKWTPPASSISSICYHTELHAVPSLCFVLGHFYASIVASQHNQIRIQHWLQICQK